MVAIFSVLLLAFGCLSQEYDGSHPDVQQAVKKATEWVKAEEAQESFNGTGFSERRGYKSTPETEYFADQHKVYERAAEILYQRHNISKRDVHRVLRQTTSNFCKQPSITCTSSKYRTMDGSCNNPDPKNAWWGMAGTSQDRLLPPDYADGRNAPRGNFQSSLPSPRFCSTQAHPDFNVVANGITNMVPQYGQFLDHDITLTPEGNKRCCDGEQDVNCWPIQIPTNDYFYGPLGQRCMSFTRSTPCTNPINGNREQMNMATACIDGSQIYGTSITRAQNLRTFSGGQLIENTSGSRAMVLPLTTQTRTPEIQGAFATGDDRVNIMPALAAMHNLWLKEHNRIARQIQTLRPGWSDEQIYQEARRIVGAQLQHITYTEFLPVVLGPSAMDSYGLSVIRGQYTSYSPNVLPVIWNEFAAAAFRFGHSLVQNIVDLVNSARQVVSSYDIKDNYNQPQPLTFDGGNGVDYILRFLILSPSQNCDVFVARGLTNFLLSTPGSPGSDLVARNMQRGRDHGVPAYNNFRRLCSLPPVTYDFPPSDMRQDSWNVLKSTYPNPDMIDLFSGCLHELPVGGGIVGSTVKCILGLQFQRLKYGDRFYYTHSNQAGSFTPTQLAEIQKQTLGSVMCRNAGLSSTQVNVMRPTASDNPDVSCGDSSRTLDITKFL